MSSSVKEKQPIETGESFMSESPRTAGADAMKPDDEPIDPKAERKLLWKLDLVIYPIFFVIYMMSFLDRINISNAKIQGMDKDLGLNEGNRFAVALFVST